MKETKKTTSKKLFFISCSGTGKVEKKQLTCFVFFFFQIKSKNNRSPTLAFVFVKKQPEVVSYTNEERFFFFVFTSLPENEVPIRLFFFK